MSTATADAAMTRSGARTNLLEAFWQGRTKYLLGAIMIVLALVMLLPIYATITASVKTKLVADKPANLTHVDVDTNHGTVYLNGSVDSAEQKARAEQLAWQANGVKGVVNNLQVRKR